MYAPAKLLRTFVYGSRNLHVSAFIFLYFFLALSISWLKYNQFWNGFFWKSHANLTKVWNRLRKALTPTYVQKCTYVFIFYEWFVPNFMFLSVLIQFPRKEEWSMKRNMWNLWQRNDFLFSVYFENNEHYVVLLQIRFFFGFSNFKIEKTNIAPSIRVAISNNKIFFFSLFEKLNKHAIMAFLCNWNSRSWQHWYLE